MHIKSIHFYQTTEEGMHFHAHAAYQLHVVVSGGGGYEFSNHKIAHVAPGSVFVIPPQWPHKIVLKNKKSLMTKKSQRLTKKKKNQKKKKKQLHKKIPRNHQKKKKNQRMISKSLSKH